MTFEEFSLSGRLIPTLVDGNWRKVVTYESDLVIEKLDENRFCLTIANEIYTSNNLMELEKILYDWAITEGYFE